MSKPIKYVQMLSTAGVIIIGIYMLINFSWGTPPAISGLAFLLTGVALWMNHCPIMKWLFEKN